MIHSFHIPVMGLAYTIDTPLRVAHYGIDSVVSIVDDELAERMRAYFCTQFNRPYVAITAKMHDSRARRITAYLNLIDELVKQKFAAFCDELLNNGQKLENLISMLPKKSRLAGILKDIAKTDNQAGKIDLEKVLVPGSIDVNIMTKVDKTNYCKKIPLPVQFNDAHAALRGYANSTLRSSLVLSAGMNPSLYSYIATFREFLPDEKGMLDKKIVLKVSDFRSAMIQGCFLAKKGVWVSEYRIESGLNCGGHAFATEGMLLGPIMEEFKARRKELQVTAHELLLRALHDSGHTAPQVPLDLRITIQGGVGTADEHEFLLQYYNADSVGWGTPFLLVPEATATDKATRQLLAKAGEKDLYRSGISPLGVPFNTVAGTTNDHYKAQRIRANRAGSSCPKKLLALNREFDGEGMCTASRKYQQIKLHEAEEEKRFLTPEAVAYRIEAITHKACLCVGLANPAYMEKDMEKKGEEQGVVVCPGPNMAYFDKEVSLYEMIRHIYGYKSVLAVGYRPNMFIKELELYVNYMKDELDKELFGGVRLQARRWKTFKENLLAGIAYYESMFKDITAFRGDFHSIISRLEKFKTQLLETAIPES